MLFDYYSDGLYIKKDPVEAEKWRRKAIERGLDTAPFRGGGLLIFY
jgi:TPR repeat protein